MNENKLIPRKIHYCWFGGKPIPDKYLKYIETWRKFFPDYEIIQWDESNFDLNACDYFRQAYENKYWAFASDYARFKIIYDEGGVYLDTDVEVIKDMSDIIAKGPFMGLEPDLWGNFCVNTGLGIALPAQNSFVKEVLDYYEKKNFIVEGIPDTKNNVCVIGTSLLEKKGLNTKLNENQKIDDINIFPTDYFCPMDFFSHRTIITDNTRTIHHYGYTWGNEREKKNNESICRFINMFGRKMGPRAWYLCNVPRLLVNLLKKKAVKRRLNG